MNKLFHALIILALCALSGPGMAETVAPSASAETTEPSASAETAEPSADTETVESTENTDTAPVQVRMRTSMGDIVLTLDQDKAPQTVENFLRYVDEGFYDGTIFHRVIDGFMIQGGGFDTNFDQKTTHEPVRNEADNGLKNLTGTIAMARTADPHSATAQFFINVSDNDGLNFSAPNARGWGYAVFGRVSDGMEVVNTIKGVRTGNRGMHRNVPIEHIIIHQASRLNPAED